MKIETTIKGIKNLQKTLKAEQAADQKALETGIKVEGYRLRRVMQREIRSGDPGGVRFAPLSYIARRLWSRRRKKPLAPLARVVRYDVKKSPFVMKIGWTGSQLSRRWKNLARMHQEGFDREISEAQRKMIVRRGAALGTIEGGDTPFFLKSETTTFHTPARPIVEPFWDRHKKEALRNIRANYAKKRRGERI